MQTKQAIQASANVVRITSISAGDLYKRFDESYDDRVYYGIVKKVHNDGEKTVIEAVEYRYSWNSLEVDYKIIRGEKDFTIFPATQEEFNLELGKAKKKKIQEIKESEEKIEENKKVLEEISKMESGELMAGLKSVSYAELTQEQYNERMLLK